MIMLIFVISMSLALLVLLGGLFMLAYSKKEGLGKISKIASYVAIVFGTFLFLSGIVCKATCGGCCAEKKCERKEIICHKEIKGECYKGANAGQCEKVVKKCCQKMNAESACEKGDAKCSKSDKACCKEGKKECADSKKECCKDKKVK
jgi:hypothetical protein